MPEGRGGSSSSKPRPGDLRPLAPSDSKRSGRPGRSTPSTPTGKGPRLSHRSRAGCWTCRARKVKCDETHPRCAQCTRLNRDCDWEHRWNFNDATTSTQGKFRNIVTTGNAVWDPALRHEFSTSPLENDVLVDFATLTTDEDRERKAGTQKPGTFGVVVTPESFHDLPEYAAVSQSHFGSRRTSGASTASSRGYKSPGLPKLRRAHTLPDPNIIVLERFEDASPVLTPTGPFSASSRRESDYNASYGDGDDMQQLKLEPTSSYSSSIGDIPPITPLPRPDDHLLRHFRQYIIPRLVQPQQTSTPSVISQGSTRDVLETEANRFTPLHHAICAVTALNLAYSRQSSLEVALQHYHQALAASATASSPSDLLSDGGFFTHYLLLVYDICVQTGDESMDMWAQHLNHLSRIAVQRLQKNGREPFTYALWTICELDMYACLMGSGDCNFVRMIGDRRMLPQLDQQVPCITTVQDPVAGAILPQEIHIFPEILRLNQGMVLLGAKLARTAQTIRAEVTFSPDTTARWHATATAMQNEIVTFWQTHCPERLGLDSSQAGAHLPDRIRTVFEHALALYNAIVIYARTSMFPVQQAIPFAGRANILADTEQRIATIMQIAEREVHEQLFERRHIIFPLFMAGYATLHDERKARCLQLIDFFVGSGIGRNTARVAQLLRAVIEEQRRVGVERVDWLTLAKSKGLRVVNCGL